MVLDYQQFEKIKNSTSDAKTLMQKLASAEYILLTIETADEETTKIWDATSALYQQGFYASVNSPINKTIYDFYNYTNKDPFYDYET